MIDPINLIVAATSTFTILFLTLASMNLGGATHAPPRS